jgi:Lon protease-like protein
LLARKALPVFTEDIAMASMPKWEALDVSQVRIAPEAYECLNEFLTSLHRRMLERAAMQAQLPGHIKIEDVVRSAKALLPIVVGELEHSLKQETTNVRHAS